MDFPTNIQNLIDLNKDNCVNNEKRVKCFEIFFFNLFKNNSKNYCSKQTSALAQHFCQTKFPSIQIVDIKTADQLIIYNLSILRSKKLFGNALVLEAILRSLNFKTASPEVDVDTNFERILLTKNFMAGYATTILKNIKQSLKPKLDFMVMETPTTIKGGMDLKEQSQNSFSYFCDEKNMIYFDETNLISKTLSNLNPFQVLYSSNVFEDIFVQNANKKIDSTTWKVETAEDVWKTDLVLSFPVLHMETSNKGSSKRIDCSSLNQHFTKESSFASTEPAPECENNDGEFMEIWNQIPLNSWEMMPLHNDKPFYRTIYPPFCENNEEYCKRFNNPFLMENFGVKYFDAFYINYHSHSLPSESIDYTIDENHLINDIFSLAIGLNSNIFKFYSTGSNSCKGVYDLGSKLELGKLLVYISFIPYLSEYGLAGEFFVKSVLSYLLFVKTLTTELKENNDFMKNGKLYLFQLVSDFKRIYDMLELLARICCSFDSKNNFAKHFIKSLISEVCKSYLIALKKVVCNGLKIEMVYVEEFQNCNLNGYNDEFFGAFDDIGSFCHTLDEDASLAKEYVIPAFLRKSSYADAILVGKELKVLKKYYPSHPIFQVKLDFFDINDMFSAEYNMQMELKKIEENKLKILERHSYLQRINKIESELNKLKNTDPPKKGDGIDIVAFNLEKKEEKKKKKIAWREEVELFLQEREEFKKHELLKAKTIANFAQEKEKLYNLKIANVEIQEKERLLREFEMKINKLKKQEFTLNWRRRRIGLSKKRNELLLLNDNETLYTKKSDTEMLEKRDKIQLPTFDILKKTTLAKEFLTLSSLSNDKEVGFRNKNINDSNLENRLSVTDLEGEETGEDSNILIEEQVSTVDNNKVNLNLRSALESTPSFSKLEDHAVSTENNMDATEKNNILEKYENNVLMMENHTVNNGSDVNGVTVSGTNQLHEKTIFDATEFNQDIFLKIQPSKLLGALHKNENSFMATLNEKFFNKQKPNFEKFKFLLFEDNKFFTDNINTLLLRWNTFVHGEFLKSFFKQFEFKNEFFKLKQFYFFENKNFLLDVKEKIFERGEKSAQEVFSEVGRKSNYNGSYSLNLNSRTIWPPTMSELARIFRSFEFNTKSLNFEYDFKNGIVGDPNAINALDFVSLDYVPPPQLRSIFSNSTTRKYQKIQNFLLQIVRTEEVLNSVQKSDWFRSKKNYTLKSRSEKKMLAFFHFIKKFLSSIMMYAFEIGINDTVSKFDVKLQEMEIICEEGVHGINSQKKKGIGFYSVVNLLATHNEMLDRILWRLFLRQNQLKMSIILKKMLQLILNFSKRIEKLERKEKSLEETGLMHNEINNIEDDFKKQLDLFYSVLENKKVLVGLDYNGSFDQDSYSFPKKGMTRNWGKSAEERMCFTILLTYLRN
ncbi:hypothetical protein HK099_001342 [Clydaea vesicula]|uniref:Gamma tubulin complex component C-terminal domain-containing protein n=1 Tax=Clydaea vesicula TaxID=447962 RepID=A0AAD5U3I8_9FUNG|nr:hypothetical protein HK099_001342 [Clydaea vesicula]